MALLDADDEWHPDKLTTQVRYLRDHPEAGACVTHVQNYLVPELEAQVKAALDTKETLRPKPGYLAQTLLARREVFKVVGDFNDSAGAGDATDWFLRARDAQVICGLLPDTLTFRRLHRNNRSSRLGELPRTVLLQFLKDSLDRKRKVQ